MLLENVRVPVASTCCSVKAAALRSRRAASVRAASITACAPSGKAEEALEKMVRRLSSRTAFGKKIIEHSSVGSSASAVGRTDIEMTRLLCLKAADMMDKVGSKTAQLEIAYDQGGRAEHGAADHRPGDPALIVAPACPTRRVSPRTMLVFAACVLPAAPTKCTTAPSPRLELRKYAKQLAASPLSGGRHVVFGIEGRRLVFRYQASRGATSVGR